MPPYSFFAAGPIEAAEHFLKGGYHPINIGDTFNNDRYRVVNKLGRGAHSTIWLVEDNVLKRLASLKVLSADVSMYSSEMEMSRVLQNAQNHRKCHPGKHHCIVTEVLGSSLDSRLTPDYYGPYNERHPPLVAMKIATQVALGVAYLHSCGIIRDNLHLGHVLFYSSKLQNPSPDEQLRIYGEVWTQRIQYFWDPSGDTWDHPTNVISVPQRKGVFDVCLTPPEAVHIKIIDFGHPFLNFPRSDHTKPFNMRTPIAYRAPEIIFGDVRSLNYSADIWALGVMLYKIMNNNHLPFPQRAPADVKMMTAYMVLSIWKLPPEWEWANKWTAIPEVNQEFMGQAPVLRFRNSSRADITEEDSLAFEMILHDIFRYKPEERIRAIVVARRMVDWLKKSRTHSKRTKLELSRPWNVTEKNRAGNE